MGNEINSHITGPLKEPMLIIASFAVLIFMQLTIMLLIRIRKEKGIKLKAIQEEAYFWLILGFALSKLFYIVGDFHIDVAFRREIYNIAYVMQWAGVFGFSFMLERNKKFITKYIFSSISLILSVGFIFVIFLVPDLVQSYSILFYLIYVIIFITFVKIGIIDFYKKNVIGNYKLPVISFITGGFMVLFGFTLASDIAINLFGLQIRILGDIFEIIGFIFLYYFFITSPSFSEYEWQDKIDSLFITHKSGLVLYSRNFREKKNLMDHTVVGGSITSVKIFLEMITEIKGDSVIEKEGKIVIIHPVRKIIGILICDEKLKSLQTLLNNFTKKVCTIYQKILEDWDGELSVFRPIENIVKEFFY